MTQETESLSSNLEERMRERQELQRCVNKVRQCDLSQKKKRGNLLTRDISNLSPHGQG